MGAQNSQLAAEDPEQTAVRRQMDEVLVEAMEVMGSHGGGINLTDPEGEVLSLDVGVGLPTAFAKPLYRKKLTTTIADPLVEAVRERKPVWIGSGEEFARRYPQPASVLPHHAMAVAPVVTGATVWGAVQFFWPPGRPRDLSPAEQHTIRATADRLAELLQSAAESGHRLLPLLESRFLPLAHPAAAEPAEAMAAVEFVTRLPEGGCALGPDGRITFVDRTAADLLGERIPQLRGNTPWEALPWLHDPTYEHRYRAAVLGQHPTSFTAVRPPDQRLLFQLYPDPTGISMRITPVGADSRPAGPDLRQPVPPTGHIRLGAIYRLMHLAGALTQAADVHDVVDLVGDQFMLACNAQAFALLVTEAGRMRTIGHRGFPADTVRSLDRTPLATPGTPGLPDGTPSFFSSRQELAREHPARAEVDDGMAAWAYLPLIASGHPVGICVLGYHQPHPFTTEERLSLTSFSGLIAQALDRARLYDAKQQLAQGLQDSLLPHTLPSIPGLEVAVRYLPSSHGIDVGGDFYDVIRTGPGHAAVVIGDVQGHNVHAAALMGQVRTAIHAYAVAGKSPGDILAHTNQLLSDLGADLLTSCLCAQVDTAEHRIRLASAGHHPPLVRRPDHRTDVLDLPPGPLLGVDPAATYPTTHIALPPGNVLTLYTDGLVETPSNRYSNDLTRVTAALSRAGNSLDDIADMLIDRTEPSGHRTDDAALLLLRIAERSDPRHGGAPQR